MRALAEAVLDLGHRRIAVISGVIDGNDRAAERLAGIRDAVVSRGGVADPAVVETPYGIETGAAAFARLMRGPARPGVVMCGNDVLAVGALQQARAMGLRVPEDVSITGFDDIELARITLPQLTTVHVPHRAMGRQAAQELIRMVEKTSPGRSAGLATTVQVRGSLGKPG